MLIQQGTCLYLYTTYSGIIKDFSGKIYIHCRFIVRVYMHRHNSLFCLLVLLEITFTKAPLIWCYNESLWRLGIVKGFLMNFTILNKFKKYILKILYICFKTSNGNINHQKEVLCNIMPLNFHEQQRRESYREFFCRDDTGCMSRNINDLSFVSMSNMTGKMSLVKLIKESGREKGYKKVCHNDAVVPKIFHKKLVLMILMKMIDILFLHFKL